VTFIVNVNAPAGGTGFGDAIFTMLRIAGPAAGVDVGVGVGVTVAV
jgi:hypothetical protein